jgi:DNA repair exonuclease SbcCD ATPase subunit
MRKILVAMALSLSGCGVAEHMGSSNCSGDLKELCLNIFGGRQDLVQADLINRNIADISENKKRIDVLESQMNVAYNQISTLESALTSQGLNLQNQIDSLVTAIGALQANDEDLQDQIGVLSSQISAVQDDVLSLQNNVSSLQGDTSNLQTSVNNLQFGLYGLGITVAGITVQNLVQTHQIDQLQNQINTVNGNLNSLTNQVNSLQTASNTYMTQLAVLNGYINIVAIYDPCGTQNNTWNEVFLKLSNGKYLASFSDNQSGLNTRFVVMKDGNYRTTDNTNCNFTVSSNGTIISNERN